MRAQPRKCCIALLSLLPLATTSSLSMAQTPEQDTGEHKTRLEQQSSSLVAAAVATDTDNSPDSRQTPAKQQATPRAEGLQIEARTNSSTNTVANATSEPSDDAASKLLSAAEAKARVETATETRVETGIATEAETETGSPTKTRGGTEDDAEAKTKSNARPGAHTGAAAKPTTTAPAVNATAPLRPPMRRGGSLLALQIPLAAPPEPPQPPTVGGGADTEKKAKADTAPYEAGEIILASADMAAAQSAARQLRAYQLQVKSRRRLNNLGLVLSVFRLPAGIQVPALVARLRTELPDLNLDSNQRYRALGGRRQYARRLIAWPEPPTSHPGEFRIGMVDTAVTKSHPALINAALEKHSFVRGKPAAPTHGTAVASLLIGAPESIAPGLLPHSRLFAAEVFRQRGEITDTTTDALLGALNWLAGKKVQVINMSLGGEYNRIFELALKQLLKRGIKLVAAAGNGGPEAPPAYPAAQPGVIAVTAVDALQRLYPQANIGDYIDLAAPGVDVWAADGGTQGRYHSGTSFAAPFVTAALLLAGQCNIRLTQSAKDLGQAGHDGRFGWGLVNITPGCPER